MPRNDKTMLAGLKTFKSKYRHCNVTQTSGKLGPWVKNARSRQKKGKLPEELKDALDTMGFMWLFEETVQLK